MATSQQKASLNKLNQNKQKVQTPLCSFFILFLFDLGHSEYPFYPWLIIGVGILLWSILYLSSQLMHWVWFPFGMWSSVTDCTSFLFGSWRGDTNLLQEAASLWCLGKEKSSPEHTLLHHLNSTNVLKTRLK